MHYVMLGPVGYLECGSCGNIVWPGEPKKRPWDRVKEVLQELDEARRAYVREPLEIWGDIVMKGTQYQPITVHGDVRIDTGITVPNLGGDFICEGTLYAGGPLAEEGGYPPPDPNITVMADWSMSPLGTINAAKPKDDKPPQRKGFRQKKGRLEKGHPAWMPWR
jgi:hypothetical protein